MQDLPNPALGSGMSILTFRCTACGEATDFEASSVCIEELGACREYICARCQPTYAACGVCGDDAFRIVTLACGRTQARCYICGETWEAPDRGSGPDA